MMRIALCRDVSVIDALLPRSRFFGTDLLVFPELVDGGYAHLRRGAGDHRLDDEFIERFRVASVRPGPAVVAGTVALVEKGVRTNSALVFARGRLIHRYDKIHLFRPSGDRKFFTRGMNTALFTLRAGKATVRAGVVICYDIRFPELVRRMALAGLQMLIVPARWPEQRDRAWRSLLAARAIENQIVVVGCNAPGVEGGRSYVFDPAGGCVCTTRVDAGSGIRSFEVDLAMVRRVRRRQNYLRDAVFLRSAVPLSARRTPRGA